MKKENVYTSENLIKGVDCNMKIEIVNLRNVKNITDGVLIKVDRSSVLGNPFYMSCEEKRDEVCNKYKDYFNKKVNEKTDANFMNELRRIYKIAKTNKVYLACWCYPKRCHAETIKNFIEKYL